MTKTIPLESGKCYHIYNRGNNKEEIFKDHNDYKYFLRLLTKHVNAITDIYCYSLLSNHFHLMIKVKEIDFHFNINGKQFDVSQAFSNLFNAYAKAFNKKYNRTGKLFADRFKRKLITSDAYFSELIYYIHANAQRHRLIKDFRDYPYSSYQEIASLQPTILNRDEVLKWFGGKDSFEKQHAQKAHFLLDYDIFER